MNVCLFQIGDIIGLFRHFEQFLKEFIPLIVNTKLRNIWLRDVNCVWVDFVKVIYILRVFNIAVNVAIIFV